MAEGPEIKRCDPKGVGSRQRPEPAGSKATSGKPPNGGFGSDLTRSPRRGGITAICEYRSGVDITNVTTDAKSAVDFRPITGGLTFAPTEIFVNVAGDIPKLGDQLILDVTTTSVTPPAVPEPSTWALMLLGFAGLGFAGYRHRGSLSPIPLHQF